MRTAHTPEERLATAAFGAQVVARCLATGKRADALHFLRSTRRELTLAERAIRGTKGRSR